jgi:hypothetical protein
MVSNTRRLAACANAANTASYASILGRNSLGPLEQYSAIWLTICQWIFRLMAEYSNSPFRQLRLCPGSGNSETKQARSLWNAATGYFNHFLTLENRSQLCWKSFQKMVGPPGFEPGTNELCILIARRIKNLRRAVTSATKAVPAGGFRPYTLFCHPPHCPTNHLLRPLNPIENA